MAPWNKESSAAVYTTPVNPGSGKEPLRSETRNSCLSNVAEFEKKDSAYKKRIRILRSFSRTAWLILNVVMMGTLSFALAKYYLTRDRLIEGNAHPWVTPATVWPTAMLLGTATVTFFMNLITLLSYCCGVGAADKASSFTSVLGYVFLFVHFAAWAVAAGLYRMARDGKNLWGYSCSDASDRIQEQVKSFLNFRELCTMQQGTWYISIIEAITYLLTFVVTLMVMRRASHKNKLANTEYEQNVELGTTYNPGVGKKYMPVAAGAYR
ncbi:hypothetical protein LHYA1_G001563 [Lachnellula hyalina]|uniref:MARVEL domain-containing protein n=1 Tax=Lachnellula hyalina TaxID=1316788 RepID=A0A8H8R856_9HELO|nr:uncharacterized protein LHYA1_G001563 [Lachnellula hyalina]TVY30330.1 hypothetical protein LHYA1_G001563 [Lachnellula hyalina]